MTQNDVNISELIQDNYVVPESVFDRKRTKTSHFMLGSIFSSNSIMSTEYFVNAFLDDENYNHKIMNPIFVLFRSTPNDSKWEMLIQKLRAKKEYVLEYITGTKGDVILTMIVFQVPPVYAIDFIKFKNGQYSKFSEDYKKFFPRYVGNNKAQPVESTLWKIINKAPDLRTELETYFTIHKKRPTTISPESELWGEPERKFENYNYSE